MTGARTIWHDAYDADPGLYEGLSGGRRIVLHQALMRDCYLTLAETLAKMTALRDMVREGQ